MFFSRKAAQQKHASLGTKGSPPSASAEYTAQTLVTEKETKTISDYGSRSATSTVAESHSTIQKDEWLAAARRSTERFKQHGSPVPLVWVWLLCIRCDL